MPRPDVLALDAFTPRVGEIYLLGPTTPARAVLARTLEQRWALRFGRLIHCTAYVSPLAQLGEGTFVGAQSVIAPGVRGGRHVFVNRGATIGHDTSLGDFTRVQPGAHLGGLSQIGARVTVGIGAVLHDRCQRPA